MQHVVVVAIGQQAMDLCEQRRSLYRHRCVLDQYCYSGQALGGGVQQQPAGNMDLNTPLYHLATIQKV